MDYRRVESLTHGESSSVAAVEDVPGRRREEESIFLLETPLSLLKDELDFDAR